MASTPQGDHEVVIVKYGTRRTTKSAVYLNFGVYGAADDPIDMDYFFWVVRNDERTIVVDTGFSTRGGAARNRTMLIEPGEALGALGVEPSQVATVVLTHAHYDHAGNLDLFPQAEIFIAARELEFWNGHLASRAQFHHTVEDDDLDQIRAAERDGRLRTWSDEVDLAPGIGLIELGGHTPGQAAVLVDTRDGAVLLASDAVHYYEEYENDMPFAVFDSLSETYGAYDRIRSLEASGAVAHLVTGHDPSTLSRFTPVHGPLAGLAATIGHRG